jgi:hypothetical protein
MCSAPAARNCSPTSSPPARCRKPPRPRRRPPRCGSGYAGLTTPRTPRPEIEALAHLGDPYAPTITAMRTRHLARFTELEERAQVNKELAGLARTTRQPDSPELLDQLPMLRGTSPSFPRASSS